MVSANFEIVPSVIDKIWMEKKLFLHFLALKSTFWAKLLQKNAYLISKYAFWTWNHQIWTSRTHFKATNTFFHDFHENSMLVLPKKSHNLSKFKLFQPFGP